MEIPIGILYSYIPCLIGYKPLEGRAVHSRSASLILLEARALASHEDHSQYFRRLHTTYIPYVNGYKPLEGREEHARPGFVDTLKARALAITHVVESSHTCGKTFWKFAVFVHAIRPLDVVEGCRRVKD